MKLFSNKREKTFLCKWCNFAQRVYCFEFSSKFLIPRFCAYLFLCKIARTKGICNSKFFLDPGRPVELFLSKPTQIFSCVKCVFT